MKSLLRLCLLCLLLFAATPSAVTAQTLPPEPLDRFVAQVARLWAAGDAAALVDLAPANSRIVLDVGENLGAVQPRHAAAALRGLFNERETTGIRATRMNFAGGQPPRGFGELTWTFRSRGMSDAQTVTLYVGTIWEGNGWRLRELRVLR
jgi:hypothetical protein